MLMAAGPEESVVQIINYAQGPNWVEPWRFSRVATGLGSGFVIKSATLSAVPMRSTFTTGTTNPTRPAGRLI